MTKKFKDKICVYCAKISEIGDHVFAREFFLESQRDNLPKVPSCISCNTKKAKLEHYLTAILPFGGNHVDAKENLAKMVPKRLSKNRKLHGDLVNSKSITMMRSKDHSGLILPMGSFDFNVEKLLELISYISKGLLWYHFNIILPPEYFAETYLFTNGEDSLCKPYFLNQTENNVIKNNLGNGAFVYQGTQSKINPESSIWEFVIYGGLALYDPNIHCRVTPKIFCFTRKKISKI